MRASLMLLRVAARQGFQPVRGVRDFYQAETELYEHVVGVMRKVAEGFHFRKIMPAVLEHSQNYQHALGGDSDIVTKEMYTIAPRKDQGDGDAPGNALCLRPEGTFSVVRMYQGLGVSALPCKVFYEGEMFRRERPQRGRYRQFYQFGVEHFWTKPSIVQPHNSGGVLDELQMVKSVGCGSEQEVEIIAMAHEMLSALGIPTRGRGREEAGSAVVRLHVNTLGDRASRERYVDALRKYFVEKKDLLSPLSRERLEGGNVLRILDSKDEADIDIVREAPEMYRVGRETGKDGGGAGRVCGESEFLSVSARKEFDHVLQSLEVLGIDYFVDKSLVRGLDYYSHTVFEFIMDTPTSSSSAKTAILAGGRYEGLMNANNSEKQRSKKNKRSKKGQGETEDEQTLTKSDPFALNNCLEQWKKGTRENPVGAVGWAAGTDRLMNMIVELNRSALKESNGKVDVVSSQLLGGMSVEAVKNFSSGAFMRENFGLLYARKVKVHVVEGFNPKETGSSRLALRDFCNALTLELRRCCLSLKNGNRMGFEETGVSCGVPDFVCEFNHELVTEKAQKTSADKAQADFILRVAPCESATDAGADREKKYRVVLRDMSEGKELEKIVFTSRNEYRLTFDSKICETLLQAMAKMGEGRPTRSLED
eukprot:Nk52_evm16s328 gene=Nk52_evmTU16s328